MDAAPITATVTAYRRVEQTLATIRIILDCVPPPDELLVHVDASGDDCFKAIRNSYPDIKVIMSEVSVGPGGGRNKLMQLARNEWVANFDDDSYPLDTDFFARAMELANAYSEATLFTGKVFHRGDTLTTHGKVVTHAASFCGGAVIFKRSHLMDAGGYLPLTIAYGAEEEDMALRLYHQNRTMLATPWLRVFHDTDLQHHVGPQLNAVTLSNIALVVFLRYPFAYWPYGLAQVANRILWCVKNGRAAGLIKGLTMIPGHLWHHRHYRSPISMIAMHKRQLAKRAKS